jgi:hypothetical protein
MTKATKTNTPAVSAHPKGVPSKLDQIAALLKRSGGASLADMMGATSWQAHSVRGALAGALKKGRGLNIVSEKTDGVRIYSVASGDQ